MGGKPTIAGVLLDDALAPIPAVRGAVTQRQGSTHCRPPWPRQRMVGL